MPGAVCTSDDEPACVTVFGINCIRLLYQRVTGIAVITSLSIVVVRRTLCTSTIGDSAVTVSVSWSAADLQFGVNRGREGAGQHHPFTTDGREPGSVNVTVYVPVRRSTMR